MAALKPTFLGIIFLASFSCAWSFPGPDEPIPAIYPYPRILLLGPTGVGKSTLANVLAGCAPNDNTCFKTCSGTNSCTGNTTINVVTYLGDDNLGEITLVDTPGFGDSHASGDGPLIANMIDVLKNTLEEANIIVLCQVYDRFDPEIQTMILEMESLFGRDRIWNHVMLEVTKWSFSAENIFNRNLTGVTEEDALADINTSIMEISHLNQSLPGVFIDSYSQFYPDDEVQQQYFQDYANQLWTLANSMPPLAFYTIEDILEQLHECQQINDCLNDVLDERITDIEQSVGHNEGQISMLWGNVDVNAVDIRSNLNNITDIGKSVGHNEDQISMLESDVGLNTVNIDLNVDTIYTNVNNIASNLERINSNSGLITTNTGNIDSHTDDIKDIKYDITSHTDDIKDIKDDITSHTNDIKDIKDDIDSNTADITTNTVLITTNTGLITTNTVRITNNKGLITTNTGNIDSNTDDIKDIKEDITSHTGDIKDIKDDIDSNTADITDIKGRLASQETQVAQCGYYKGPKTNTGQITYDTLLTDVATDHSILDTVTGTYTVLTTGQFVITFSAWVRMDTNEAADIYLYRDGARLDDTEYRSYYHGNNFAYDQGSRTVVLSLTAGQEIQLRADYNTADIYHIMFCIHLV